MEGYLSNLIQFHWQQVTIINIIIISRYIYREIPCFLTKIAMLCSKSIGAKYYRSDGKLGLTGIKSPRDSEGHGSHTASMASLLGLGSGTARGGLPSARIAVYKICLSDGCSDAISFQGLMMPLQMELILSLFQLGK